MFDIIIHGVQTNTVILSSLFCTKYSLEAHMVSEKEEDRRRIAGSWQENTSSQYTETESRRGTLIIGSFISLIMVLCGSYVCAFAVVNFIWLCRMASNVGLAFWQPVTLFVGPIAIACSLSSDN